MKDKNTPVEILWKSDPDVNGERATLLVSDGVYSLDVSNKETNEYLVADLSNYDLSGLATKLMEILFSGKDEH